MADERQKNRLPATEGLTSSETRVSESRVTVASHPVVQDAVGGSAGLKPSDRAIAITKRRGSCEVEDKLLSEKNKPNQSHVAEEFLNFSASLPE